MSALRVPVDGADLYVEVGSDGPPELSINGSGSALDARRGQHAVRLTVERAFHCRRLRPSRPGSLDHGRSRRDVGGLHGRRGGGGGRAGRGPVRGRGASFGDMVAQEVAVMHPERLTRLVLGYTSSGGGGGNSYLLHERPHAFMYKDLRARSVIIEFLTGPS